MKMSATVNPVLEQSDSLQVYDNILQTIGNTPLVRLGRVGKNLPCPLYAKVEFFNPGGSVKDRIGLNIIEEAERSGRLKPGGTIVESTSGNTGVGLAIAAALKGYKTIFVMPDKMSQEKILLLRAFGAQVVITPTAVAPEDPRSYYNVAKRLVEETPNAILANQYHNPENPRSHYQTTGPEIWRQTGGRVTDVVIGMGTGGTISGTGRYLKEQNPAIRIVGVDPQGSILKDLWENNGKLPPGVEATTYKVEGIGEDFLPSTTDLSVVDEIVRVNDRESFIWARRLVREEGIFAGGSSGAALAGALKYARSLPSDRLVVVLLPDSGSRYLSKFYDDKWMRENGFLENEWGETTLDEILATKAKPELITARTDDRMVDVIALFKRHDISQVPVVHADGTLAGMLTEVELLNHMLEASHTHSADETIETLVRPVEHTFRPQDTLDDARLQLSAGEVVLVVENERPLGILTKIDLLDFLARRL